MNKIKIILYILAIPLGVLMFIYGEIGDSPGGQLIGLITVVLGVVGLVRDIKLLNVNIKEK